jgi:phosphoribosyl 1,2-cyclic phosphate phosphodiesterase
VKISFLGTGTSQGVPVIGCECEVCSSIDFHDRRLRSSVLVETPEVSVVIDTGPDFREQMLRHRVKKLDAVLFTHAHKDHTAGLDDIRSFNFLQNKDMPLYARKEVIEQLKMEFSYVFNKTSYPGVPRVEVCLIDSDPFSISGLDVIPIEVKHLNLPVLGFRIGGFTYITDANFISEVEKEKIKGSEVLVLNALQVQPHVSHFTLDEAVALATEIGASKTYFTHISHKLGLHRLVSKKLPDKIELAWDGLCISI